MRTTEMIKRFTHSLLLLALLALPASAQIINGGIFGGGGDLVAKASPTAKFDGDQLVYTDAAIQLNSPDKSRLAMGTNWNPGTKDFAVSAHIYLDTSTATQTIICTGGTSNGQDGFCLQIDSDGNVLLGFNDSVQASRLTATFTTALADTTWYHLLLYCDRSGNATLYVNGVADNVTLAISTHAADLGATGGNIGSDLTPNNYFNGRLDSLMLFEKADLSSVIAAMASALHNSGEGMLATDLTATQITDWGGKYAYDLGETSGVRYSATGFTANNLTPTYASIIAPPVYGDELLTNGGFETAGTNGGTISGTLSATVARSSNVATMTTATAHGLSNGNVVTIASCTDTTYNATGVTVTVSDGTTFTYASTGGDEGAKPDATGVIATDVFGTWEEQVQSGGRVETETTDVFASTKSAKLVYGTGGNTFVRQATSGLTAGSTYQYELWCHGDGTNAPTYAVVGLPSIAAVSIGTAVSVTGTNYTKISFAATVPAGDNGLRLSIYAPAVAGGATYVDSVSLKAVTTAAISAGGFESWTVPSAANLCSSINGNFDTAGAGGADVFGTWVEAAGSGAIAAETTIVHTAGGKSAKLSTVTGASYMYLPVSSLTATGVYKLSFWAYGSGTYAGRYAVTNSAGTVAFVDATSTGVTAATWTKVEKIFILPTGNTALRIYLYSNASSASDVYFDDLELVQLPSNADTWTESVAGSSLIRAEDDSPYHGVRGLAMQVDASSSKAAIQLASNLTVGKTYSYTIYAKAASGTPGIRVGTATTYNTETLSTSYAAKTNTFVADATTLEISCVTASSTVYLDSLTELATVVLPQAGIVRGLASDANFATSLNGSSQYYNGGTLDLGTGDFWLFGAFYANSISSDMAIFGKYQDANASWRLLVKTTGRLELWAEAGNVEKISLTTNASVVAAGRWHTFSVEVDRDSAAASKIYVNGVNVTSGTPTVSTDNINNTRDLRLSNYAGGSLFTGFFDNIGIANRIPTEAERTWMHNNGEWRQWEELGVAGTDGANLTSSVITGFWDFESATALGNDRTTNNNDLTPQGTPTRVQGINYIEGVGSYWQSLTGSATAEIETLAKRPAYDTVTNSFAVLDADGVDDYHATSLVGGDAGTAVLVLKNGATGDVYMGMSEGTETIYIKNVAGVITAGAGNSPTALTSNEDPTTGYRIVVFVWGGNGQPQFLMVDGVVEDTETQAAEITVTQPFYLFAENDDGTAKNFAEASIAYAITSNTAISQSHALGITKRLQNSLGLSP